MRTVVIIGKWFWVAAIAVTFLNAAVWRVRVRRRIKENPELQEGYTTIIRGFVIWGNLPWVVMGIGCVTGRVPSLFHYFRPRDENSFVIAFYLSVFFVWGLATYWTFLRKGAETLITHPGLFNYDFKSPLMIKVLWLAALAAGVVGLVMMSLQDIPIPGGWHNR